MEKKKNPSKHTHEPTHHTQTKNRHETPLTHTPVIYKMLVPMCMHAYVDVHVYTHVYTCMHIFVWLWLCLCVCAHVFGFITALFFFNF